MPTSAPTTSFSARWQSWAIVVRSSDTTREVEQGRRDRDLERRRRTEPRRRRHITLNEQSCTDHGTATAEHSRDTSDVIDPVPVRVGVVSTWMEAVSFIVQ